MITISELSAIMYSHDPMGTQCRVNRNMENEYDSEASHMIHLMEMGVPFKTALHDVFSFFFWDGCLIDNSKAPIMEAEYYNLVQSYKI